MDLPNWSWDLKFVNNNNIIYIVKGNAIHTNILLCFKKSKMFVTLTLLNKDLNKVHLYNIIIVILNYNNEKKLYCINCLLRNQNKEINLIHVNAENF